MIKLFKMFENTFKRDRPIRIALMILALIHISDFLIKSAYAERGYQAMGGEYLAILIIAGVFIRLDYLLAKESKKRP